MTHSCSGCNNNPSGKSRICKYVFRYDITGSTKQPQDRWRHIHNLTCLTDKAIYGHFSRKSANSVFLSSLFLSWPIPLTPAHPKKWASLILKCIQERPTGSLSIFIIFWISTLSMIMDSIPELRPQHTQLTASFTVLYANTHITSPNFQLPFGNQWK